jgi:hypothetical protein
MLDPEARHELIVALLPYAGFRIDIFAFSKSTEVLVLADMLHVASRHAGCKCKLWVAISERLRISGGEGVSLAYATDSTPEELEAVHPLNNAFGTALGKSGIRYSFAIGGFAKTDLVEQVPSPAPSVLPWDASDVAPYRIQIIEKPLLDPNWPVTPPQA